MRNKNKQAGLSLIELLVVSTIIIVLTTIGLMSFSAASKNSRDAKRKADMETVRQGLVLYRADKGMYPSGTVYGTMAQVLVGGDYMTDPYPTDPKNVSPNIYSYSSDGSDFCVCANMENSSNASSPTECPQGTTTYCVENP